MVSETAASPFDAGRSWLVRWSPIGGIAYCAGIVFLVASPASEGGGDTPSELVREAESNEGWYGAHTLFSILFLFVLAWFVAGLTIRLRDSGARDESVVTLIGGLVFAVLFFVWETLGFTWLATIAGRDTEEERLSAATTYLDLDPVLWSLLAGAGIGAGLMAIAASTGALRAGLVSRWVGRVGVVLGLVSLATIAFVGALAWFLWILLASGWMLVRERGGQTSTASNSS